MVKKLTTAPDPAGDCDSSRRAREDPYLGYCDLGAGIWDKGTVNANCLRPLEPWCLQTGERWKNGLSFGRKIAVEGKGRPQNSGQSPRSLHLGFFR
jgi:hypothetical protein